MFRYHQGLFKRERNLNIDSDHLERCLLTLPSTSASCPILSCLYTCTPVHTQWTHGHTLAFKGFPGGSDGKESACNMGDLGLIPGFGRSPGEGTGYPLQYSGLKNSMDRGGWQTIVHGVTKSRTQLSDFHFHTFFQYFVKICFKNHNFTADQSGENFFLIIATYLHLYPHGTELN